MAWQKVYSSKAAHKAEIVRSILTEKGLNPVVVNKRDSAYQNFGDFEVLVSPDMVIRALKIIDDDISFT